jgi:hypothetical protein
MFISFTFWLVVLALLIAYLCMSVWLRLRAAARAEQARLRAIEREYPPRVFDTAAIAPQIERVRIAAIAVRLHPRVSAARHR